MRRLTQRIVAVTFLLACVTHYTTRASQQSAPHDIVIPFTLTDQNNIVVKAMLNETDALDLMLHTAAADVELTEDAVKRLNSLKFTDSHKVKSWGGESDSRFSQGNRVQIGELHRGGIVVWEDKNSGKGSDGKFGLDFFQKRIVEIDFDQRRIVLHERLPAKAKQFGRLKLTNKNGQFFVQGDCLLEGKRYANQFLIHSGYAGGVLLDDAFAASSGVDGKIKITDETNLKDSFGNLIKVKKGLLPGFALGKAKLADVPTGFFAGNIGRQKMSLIGCAVLTQFNLIFDIANNSLYVKARPA